MTGKKLPVTTVERRTDAAEERTSLIGRIAAGLAHELNGPIGVAIGFTDLARETVRPGDGAPDPAALKKLGEYLDLIHDAGLRARTLTRLMWSFAKEQPGTVSRFDLSETLSQACALAAPALKVDQIETDSEGCNPAASAHADPVLCRQSLVAILLASPSALPDGGTVACETSCNATGTVDFTIRAQPWGDFDSIPWVIPDSVRRTLETQGASIHAEESPGNRGHEVQGCLPAGDPANAMERSG